MSLTRITPATQLTILRILMAIAVVGLLFIEGWFAKGAALLFFMAASFTDWLDGWLARRWKQESDLGALLDPIADKALVLGTLIGLAWIGLFPMWMAVVILIRDLLVTGTRLSAAGRSIVLSASPEGKHKTVWQMCVLVGGLMLLLLREMPFDLDPRLDVWLARLVLASLWIALILTLTSGVSFFWRHRKVIAR